MNGDGDSAAGRDAGARLRSRTAAPGAGPTAVERWVLRRVLRSLGVEWLRVELWDGEPACPGEAGAPTLRIDSRAALLRILRSPSLGFGDGYSDGSIRLDGDLRSFLLRLYESLRGVDGNALARLWDQVAGRPRANSLHRSRENIHSHYDLGNDFYALWLDERMVYTCAYYPTPQTALAGAQVAKMEHVCRKLALEPGQRVLELGCGWGALALHMARHHGVEVTAYNISGEQIRFARERAAREGLAQRVRFVEDDYRCASGSHDRVVSVGMLEHVGVENYRQVGAVIDRCLAAEGLGLIHTIGRSQRRRMDPWTEKRIFPGAYPPTLAEMAGIFEPHGLAVLDVENLRLHYARTCHDWAQRFERARDEVCGRFGERFARAWRLYLVGAEVSFITGYLHLYQVLFARQANNALPWTRGYMYPTV